MWPGQKQVAKLLTKRCSLREIAAGASPKKCLYFYIVFFLQCTLYLVFHLIFDFYFPTPSHHILHLHSFPRVEYPHKSRCLLLHQEIIFHIFNISYYFLHREIPRFHPGILFFHRDSLPYQRDSLPYQRETLRIRLLVVIFIFPYFSLPFHQDSLPPRLATTRRSIFS